MDYARNNRWLLLAAALAAVALTWVSSAQWVASQDAKPQFSADDCPAPQGGYDEAERGHGAAPGGLICHYYKAQGGDPLLENWKNLYITYYSTPEEVSEEIGRFLTDDHVKKFLCSTWDDCDRIDRSLLERTDSSLYGYSNTLTNDPISYSLERRFAYGSYVVTIFVQGEIFAGVDQAMAEVAELETAARTIIDQPRMMISLEPVSTAEAQETAQMEEPAHEPTQEPAAPGPEIDEDKVGMACDEYCKSLEPIGFWLDGESYPDCRCDCGVGNAYVALNCVPCTEMCAGPETYLYKPYQQECTCLCDDPAMIWSSYRGSCVPGPDKTGLKCDQYCAELVSAGVGDPERTYPDCSCKCSPGELFVESALQCVPCAEWCAGDGTRLVTDKDRPCGCTCTDPLKKWDPATRTCIGLDGTECNGGNGCEPEFGENCSNCADCGCYFGSPANRIYDWQLTCDPGNPRADIYGCVFDIPTEAEQLEIMREEWNQCRDAWLLMIVSSNSGARGYQAEVMNAMTSLQEVTTWQQKSGCIPEAGVVLWREAVDPTVCLMRYCDRINAGIHELEQRVEGKTPVVRGPAIKVSPPGASVTIGPGQTVRFEGPVSIRGERPASLQSPLGAGFAHSVYEIVQDPNSGMEVYLFDGAYSHTYYDPAEGVAKREVLQPGERLTVDLDGVPVSRTAFDSAMRDPWWEGAEYLVDCPENAHQEGPDCACDSGFEVDPWLERCVRVEATQPEVQPTEVAVVSTNPPPVVQVTVTPSGAIVAVEEPSVQEQEDDDTTATLVIILGVIAVLVIGLALALVLVLRRR